MRYLLSSGLLLLCSLFSILGQDSSKIWNELAISTGTSVKYRINIYTPKHNFSGIAVIANKDGIIKGTVINEFGFKSFDFEMTDKRCNLLNVMSFLDSPLIKKTIASDMFFLFNIDNIDYKKRKKSRITYSDSTLTISYRKKQKRPSKEIVRYPDGEIVYNNKNLALIYTFKLINPHVAVE